MAGILGGPGEGAPRLPPASHGRSSLAPWVQGLKVPRSMPRAWSRVHSTHLALHRFSPTPSSLQHRPSACQTEPPAQLCSRGCSGHGVPSCFGHAHPPPRPRPAGHFGQGRGASPPVGLSALPPPPPQLGPISPAGWPGFSSAQPAPRPRPPSATSLFPVPAVALTEAASPTSAPGRPAHPGLPGLGPAHLRWGCPAPWPPSPAYPARLRWGCPSLRKSQPRQATFASQLPGARSAAKF